MRNSDFYYLTGEQYVIRITASRRPSEKTKPKSGTWKVKEFDGNHWGFPIFPEITWKTLSDLTYIGRVRHTDSGALV